MKNAKFSVLLISLVGGWWSTPSYSFISPTSYKRFPRIQSGAPAEFTNRHYHQTTGGVSQHKKSHHLNMLPSMAPISFITTKSQTLAITTIYFLFTNTVYLLRRSHVRNMQKRKLLQIRLTREEGVSTSLYVTNIIAWQLFVTTVFPLLEPISRIFGYVSFYYFYPNASGVGVIFEPLSAQSLTVSKRAKSQIRCDWHRFSFNVGAIGRDGFRHPPSVEKNWPHVDIPGKGWKHWPWRRRWSQG